MFKEGRNNEGFTLVELLIVLAVIAALLAIVTPVAVNAVKRAKATQVASTLRNVAAAVQQYYYTEEQMATSVSALENAGYIQGNVSDYELTKSDFSTAPATSDTTVYVLYNVAITDAKQRDSIQKVWSEVNFNSDNKPYVKVEVSRYW